MVHHNHLKPYRGSIGNLPASSSPISVVDSAVAPHSVPLTALSGALPFRPPTPPYVPNPPEKQYALGAKTDCSAQTVSLPKSVPQLSVCPRASQVPGRVILPSVDLTSTGSQWPLTRNLTNLKILFADVLFTNWLHVHCTFTVLYTGPAHGIGSIGKC